MSRRLRADFNGFFGDILCMSHGETCTDESGATVELHAGMLVTAFEEDEEDGEPIDLVASGVIERAPPELERHGSRWVLRIDARGLQRIPRSG